MANHLVTMPAPSDLEPLAHLLRPLRSGEEAVVHIIPHRCSCTSLLLTHLAERGPLPGLREYIVLSGPLPDHQQVAIDAGFTVHHATTDELVDAEVRAGPLLVRIGSSGDLKWVGGYFDGPGLDRPLDVRVLQAVALGRVPESLPLFGCAIDPALRDQLDPFRIGWLFGR
jgi:hypothetical protein